MRLLSLLLQAFGKFTDTTIALSPHSSLHLLYGPNEAGKSTTLRAIESVFFEIDRQTSDDFIHSYAKMRVGATVLDERGRTCTLIRRKGNRNTLTDEKGGVITKEELLSLFGSVTQKEFLELYCLDRDRLLQGNRELLDTNGRIGPTILNAQIDSRPLLLAESLKSKAESYFKGHKAAATVIDRALLEYREQKKIAATGDHREFTDVTTRLSSLEEERAKILEAISRDRLKHARVERLIEGISLAARLDEVEGALSELDSVPELTEEFEATFTSAWDSYITGRTKTDHFKRNLDLSKQELEQLTCSESELKLLSHEAVVEALSGRISEYSRDRQRVLQLEQVRERVSREVDELAMELLGQETIELPASLLLPDKQRLRTLLDERKSIVTSLLALDKEECEIKASLARIVDELRLTGEALDPAPLRSAIDAAKELGKIDDEVARRRVKLDGLKAAARDRFNRLSLRAYTYEEFLTAPLPIHSLIQEYSQELKQARERVGTAEREVLKGAREMEELERKIRDLTEGRRLPTEEELIHLRQERDLLLENPESFESLDKLKEMIIRCDETADLLRHDAARIGQLALLKSQLSSLQGEVSRKTDDLKREREHLGGVEERWRREVPNEIAVVAPEVMLEVCAERAELLRLERDIQEEEREVFLKLNDIERAHTLLSTAGIKDGNSLLQERVRQGELELAKWEGVNGKRTALLIRREDLSDRLEQSKMVRSHQEEGLQKLETEWRECVRELGIPRLVFSDRAQQCLDRFDELGERRRERSKVESELRETLERLQGFDHLVTKILTDSALSSTETVNDLHLLVKTLADIKRREERRTHLKKAIAQDDADLSEIETEFEVASARINDAMRITRASGADEVRETIIKARRKSLLRNERHALRSQIRRLAGGDDDDLFLSEVSRAQLTLLEQELHALQHKIREGEEIRDRLSQEIGGLQRSKSDIEGSTSVLDAEVRAQEAAARVQSAIRPYLLYRLSSKLLTLHIEEYRKSNQQPLLTLASDYFAKFTADTYTELVPFYDGEIEDWVIMCRRRSDASLVSLPGLSQAGRSALFLALRLASVTLREQRTGEKIPVVFDDILVDLDDERTSYALHALAELSKKHQILLFTHHEHLVTLASQCRRSEIEIVSLEDRTVREGEIGNA